MKYEPINSQTFTMPKHNHYIYIYIYRERERERERVTLGVTFFVP